MVQPGKYYLVLDQSWATNLELGLSFRVAVTRVVLEVR